MIFFFYGTTTVVAQGLGTTIKTQKPKLGRVRENTVKILWQRMVWHSKGNSGLRCFRHVKSVSERSFVYFHYFFLLRINHVFFVFGTLKMTAYAMLLPFEFQQSIFASAASLLPLTHTRAQCERRSHRPGRTHLLYTHTAGASKAPVRPATECVVLPSNGWVDFKRTTLQKTHSARHWLSHTHTHTHIYIYIYIK